MMNEIVWRLVPEVIALVPFKNREIYLVAPEKESYITQVAKKFKGTFTRLNLDNEGFSMTVTGKCIYLKHNGLPRDEWYKVSNFYEPDMEKFIMESEVINNGIVANEKMHAIFSDDYDTSGLVSFTSTSRPGYIEAEEEMSRRLSCELFSKTKKWVAGHKYESLDETIIYLCPVRIRKTNPTRSDYSEPVDAWIYTNRIGNEKSIDEVLKNHVFGQGKTDLKIAYKMSSMVDAGEVLVDDFKTWDDYVPYLMDGAKKRYTKMLESGFSYIEDLNGILIPLLMTDPKTKTKEIQELLREVLYDQTLLGWNLVKFRKEMVLNSSKTEDELVEALKLILFLNVFPSDANILKQIFWYDFLKDAGIELENLCKEALRRWEMTDLKCNIETYKKFSFWFTERTIPSNVNSTQRETSTKYKLDKTTLKDIFGECMLREVIIKLIRTAENNFGLGVEEFEVTNLGTLKSPVEYVTCKVTLEDILKSPDYNNELEQDILDHNFTYVTAVYDKNGNLV